MAEIADLLSVSAIAKRFPGGAGIRDVSLALPAGSITGFIGANGSGKSTTLRCIVGLVKTDAGEIRIMGAPVSRAARRQIGFMPEERGLFAHERAREVIAFHGRLKGMRKGEAFAQADALLARIGLGGRERTRVGALSKGNAQRVQVLCALVHRPRILLLDEPLSGLDPVAQVEVLSLLAEFRAGGGGVLFSTHSMKSVDTVCDRVVMLADGCTVFEGDTASAAAYAPHGVIVISSHPEALKAAARSVGASVNSLGGASAEAARFQVVLPRSVTHPALLRALSEYQVPIHGFEPFSAGVEGAFLQLATAQAAERRAESLAA